MVLAGREADMEVEVSEVVDEQVVSTNNHALDMDVDMDMDMVYEYNIDEEVMPFNLIGSFSSTSVPNSFDTFANDLVHSLHHNQQANAAAAATTQPQATPTAPSSSSFAMPPPPPSTAAAKVTTNINLRVLTSSVDKDLNKVSSRLPAPASKRPPTSSIARPSSSSAMPPPPPPPPPPPQPVEVNAADCGSQSALTSKASSMNDLHLRAPTPLALALAPLNGMHSSQNDLDKLVQRMDMSTGAEEALNDTSGPVFNRTYTSWSVDDQQLQLQLCLQQQQQQQQQQQKQQPAKQPPQLNRTFTAASSSECLTSSSSGSSSQSNLNNARRPSMLNRTRSINELNSEPEEVGAGLASHSHSRNSSRSGSTSAINTTWNGGSGTRRIKEPTSARKSMIARPVIDAAVADHDMSMSNTSQHNNTTATTTISNDSSSFLVANRSLVRAGVVGGGGGGDKQQLNHVAVSTPSTSGAGLGATGGSRLAMIKAKSMDAANKAAAAKPPTSTSTTAAATTGVITRLPVNSTSAIKQPTSKLRHIQHIYTSVIVKQQNTCTISVT